jgi:hypothetical protein
VIGANVSGFSAHVYDRLAARYLPALLVAMSEEQRREVLATQAEVRQSAAFWDSVKSAERGNAAMPFSPAGASSAAHEVGVAEVVQLLGLGARQVRNIAQRWEPEGLARKVGMSWLLDRAAVEALAEARRRRSA